MTGSEACVRTLERLGVQVIFGLCGDTTLPLYEALHDIDHGMRHVLTRDERSASFIADAYARFSGRVGVCEGRAAAVRRTSFPASRKPTDPPRPSCVSPATSLEPTSVAAR